MTESEGAGRFIDIPPRANLDACDQGVLVNRRDFRSDGGCVQSVEGVPRGEECGGIPVRDALGSSVTLAVSPNRRYQGLHSLDCDIAEGELVLYGRGRHMGGHGGTFRLDGGLEVGTTLRQVAAVSHGKLCFNNSTGRGRARSRPGTRFCDRHASTQRCRPGRCRCLRGRSVARGGAGTVGWSCRLRRQDRQQHHAKEPDLGSKSHERSYSSSGRRFLSRWQRSGHSVGCGQPRREPLR